jgi:spore coat protein U-like protein
MRTAFQRLSALAALSTALLAGTAAPSLAGTATTSFSVTATVANSCIVSASSLAFPTYLPTSATATAGSTALNVTCTLGAPYTVALSNGSGTGADPTAGASGRKMTGPSSALLAYNLYQDAAYTQALGLDRPLSVVGNRHRSPGAADGLWPYPCFPSRSCRQLYRHN